MKTLVTGGAGFIGSFLVDLLVKEGHEVRVLDNLEPQVHQGKKPSYLNPKVKYIFGDVRNMAVFEKALKGNEVVFHLASVVGVGQSNYEVKKYVEANVDGTANLIQLLISTKHKVKKVLLPSSMTGYGEGNYLCQKCGLVRPPLREEAQLLKKRWELYCPICHKLVKPVATGESALDYPNSVYAISKKAQQDLLLLYGKLYNLPVTVLKLFNVYGPRQSLSNPYTGVSAIFISRIKNDQPANIFEDGMQTRDFVSVHDVALAFYLAMKNDKADNQVFNIGSGKAIPIKDIAQTLANLLNKPSMVNISNESRKNDIRHCFADTSKARKLLGWSTQVTLKQGLDELIKWSATQKAKDDFSTAQKELKDKGLA